MPIVHQFNNEEFPQWSELRFVKKYIIKNGQTIDIDTGYSKAAVFAFDGFIKVTTPGGDEVELMSEGDVKDPSHKESVVLNCGKFTVANYMHAGYWMGYCEFYVFAGNMDWCMIEHFRLGPTELVENIGDPTEYDSLSNNNFFTHYHDYDEFWLVARGSGLVLSEEVLYKVTEGDLVATKRGDSHDFPYVAPGYAKCIGFKSRMGGLKRIGFCTYKDDGEPVVRD